MRRTVIVLSIVVLCGALWTLAFAGPAAQPAAEADSQSPVALAEQNPELVPYLLQLIYAIRDSEAKGLSLRNEAPRALIQTGPKAIPAIRGALSHNDPKMRVLALELLLSAASAPQFPINSVVPDVLKLAKEDADGNVRESASSVLVQLLRFAGNDTYRQRHHDWFMKDGTGL